jgi:hypothetical protein
LADALGLPSTALLVAAGELDAADLAGVGATG